MLSESQQYESLIDKSFLYSLRIINIVKPEPDDFE